MQEPKLPLFKGRLWVFFNRCRPSVDKVPLQNNPPGPAHAFGAVSLDALDQQLDRVLTHLFVWRPPAAPILDIGSMVQMHHGNVLGNAEAKLVQVPDKPSVMC